MTKKSNEVILQELNATNKNTLMEQLGIEYTQFSMDSITAKMPVNAKVHQPYGLLHGGATAALAETVGSVLSAAQVNPKEQGAVGTNLNIYHLQSVREGWVFANAHFIRKGKSIHVINIDVFDENKKKIAYAILTTKIINLPS